MLLSILQLQSAWTANGRRLMAGMRFRLPTLLLYSRCGHSTSFATKSALWTPIKPSFGYAWFHALLLHHVDVALQRPFLFEVSFISLQVVHWRTLQPAKHKPIHRQDICSMSSQFTTPKKRGRDLTTEDEELLPSLLPRYGHQPHNRKRNL